MSSTDSNCDYIEFYYRTKAEKEKKRLRTEINGGVKNRLNYSFLTFTLNIFRKSRI